MGTLSSMSTPSKPSPALMPVADQQTLGIIQQAYASFKSGNVPAILASLSADVDWRLPAMAGVPVAGRRKGPAEVAQFFKLLNETLEFHVFEIDSFVAQGNKVVSIGHSSVTVRATGKKIEDEFVHVFTLANGRITNFQEYPDTAAIIAAHRK